MLGFGIELSEVEQELNGIVPNLEVIRVPPLKLAGPLSGSTFIIHHCPIHPKAIPPGFLRKKAMTTAQSTCATVTSGVLSWKSPETPGGKSYRIAITSGPPSVSGYCQPHRLVIDSGKRLFTCCGC